MKCRMQKGAAASWPAPPLPTAAATRATPTRLPRRPSLLEGFQNPEDFTVKEQTLTYSNGDVYKVSWLWAVWQHRQAAAAAAAAAAPSPSLAPAWHASWARALGLTNRLCIHGIRMRHAC